MEREKFKSRLGFILISAGCAIGIGNVWRFPYVTGAYGGGVFVLFYILFLLILGIPIMSMEFAVGRKSRKSVTRAFHALEKPGQKWHLHGYVALFANYVLMFFYTVIAGWMLYYFVKMLTGGFEGLSSEGVVSAFSQLTATPSTMFIFTFIIIIIGLAVCSLGLQNGVEKITKFMMLALLGIMVILAINSFFMDGSSEGLKFYLVPDIDKINDVGLYNVIIEAMKQSFFTLSIGIGSMEIFGSYLDSDSSLIKESITIAGLDTFVAIVAGMIIFPACFSYGVNPDSGPSLIFITLPNIFIQMPGGNIWGSLFFLFMTFAAFSTVIAVFENIISSVMDLIGWSRKKTVLVNVFIFIIGAIPCILGFNILSGITPFGAGSNILDLEDFLVSQIFLPFGSLLFVLFATSKFGWGWDNYAAEVGIETNNKKGRFIKFYFKYILPVVVFALCVYGLITKFA